MDFAAPYEVFRFVSWEKQGSELHFHYAFDDSLNFTEKLLWPNDVELPDSVAFSRAADAYHLLAGISYYKAYLAPKIAVENQQLNEAQVHFLNQTFTQGLGEYLFVNKLDPTLVGSFEATTENSTAGSVDSATKPLVLIGGGKDSLATANLLQTAKTDFDTFRVNPQQWINEQLTAIGAPARTVQRELDPRLIEQNKQGALNGHVPVTAIVSAAATLQAVVSNNSAVIVSNESSANIPNTVYKGLDINHQYSKSLEFEKGFAEYIANNIASGLEYFSLLRPWSELRIAEYFAQHVMAKYSKLWSSSNHNFRRDAPTSQAEWDPRSPKSLSVFGMLAAFVPREQLLDELGFNGFTSGDKQTWNELLGVSGIKPFECVADIDEMRTALTKARVKGDWPELNDFTIPESGNGYLIDGSHRIPEAYLSALNDAAV